MARLDLDDLPPRVAALLTDLPAGEELLLVQHGAVVGRLIAPDAPEPEESPDEDDAARPDQKLREVFETFRSSIEDEF